MGAGALPGGHLSVARGAENGARPREAARRTPERSGARGAHLDMVGAVLAGDGLERVAEIAAAGAGAPVCVIVPRLGTPPPELRPHHRYVTARLAGREVEPPRGLAAEVPIESGGERIGAVLMLGHGGPEAEEFLHLAAVAALTEVAVNEAREETEASLRGSFLEELRARDDLGRDEVLRRARRLGVDLEEGAVALCADPGGRAPGRLLPAVTAEREAAVAQAIDGRLFALIPGSVEDARRVATRLGRQATVGLSSRYSDPGDLRRALEEAELVLDVTLRGGGPPDEGIGSGTYRLLFRVLASHPEEVRSFYEDTVAPIVRYDEQYRTDLVGTLEAYLASNCSMNATASAIFAHRHTVAYRLERIHELSGLSPLATEDRERLGLGLKAYRIIQPQLPR